ncbi:MAG: hypothetical protein GC181_11465 [Bacteroidetes bacterium]|nr:hypothetical protein [Bacteroidota bacterium]
MFGIWLREIFNYNRYVLLYQNYKTFLYYSKSKNVFEQEMLETIADKKLDDYNRILIAHRYLRLFCSEYDSYTFYEKISEYFEHLKSVSSDLPLIQIEIYNRISH